MFLKTFRCSALLKAEVKLLGQMAATEAGVRRTSRGSSGIPDEAAESFDDSESDRLSCGGSSRRGDARSSVSRQAQGNGVGKTFRQSSSEDDSK